MAATPGASATSWVDVPAGSDFPIQNLPYGVIQKAEGLPAVGTAIGDHVLDLAALYDAGLLPGEDVFSEPSLNAFMEEGRDIWTAVRSRLIDLLADGGDPALRENDALCKRALLPMDSVRMLLPVAIGDFTDFYSSREHATNVGIMFRGKENALMPNWLHLPVGYHGRSSTIFPSGTDIRRPCGQTKADDADAPSYGPSRLLDFELEMGFFVGKGNEPGTRISTNQAADHIFGMVLLNDWSARDIQKWEYQPLGPFLGKSFGTSISPWVVTMDALAPFRVPAPSQDPDVLPYLSCAGDQAYDIKLEAFIQSKKMAEPMRITATNFKHMYWTMVQQLAHHTVNGTAMRCGDLCGSGTISGPTDDSRGSMLEICWKGTKPLTLPDGSERKFFADGDTVIIRGWCEGGGVRIGFGEARGTILPAME